MSKKRLIHGAVKEKLLEDTDVLATYNEISEEYQLFRKKLRLKKQLDLSQAKIVGAIHGKK